MGSDQTDPKAPQTPDSGHHVNPEDDKITLEVSKKLDKITLEVSKKPAETTTSQCSLDVMEESTTVITNDAIDEENDGFKTPENQGIPPMTECPPAPICKKRSRYDDELYRPRVRRRHVHIPDAAFEEFLRRVDISLLARRR